MKKITLFSAVLVALTVFVHAQDDKASLPKSLKVGSFVYSVGLSGDLASHDELGTMNCDTLRISIQDGLSVQKQREVILHEALHTAYCVPHIMAGEKPTFTEEQGVYMTAPHLVMILRDNPDLVKFLTR